MTRAAFYPTDLQYLFSIDIDRGSLAASVFRAPTERSALTMFDPLGGYVMEIEDVDDGTSRAPLETRAFVSARFDTGAAKYRWLSNTQCVGYGRIQIVSGVR